MPVSPSLMQLAVKLAHEFTREQIDEGLAHEDIRDCDSPWGVRHLLRRLHQPRKIRPLNGKTRDSLQAATKEEWAELEAWGKARDKRRALKLVETYQQMTAAKQAIPEHLRKSMIDAHRLRELPLPPDLQEPP